MKTTVIFALVVVVGFIMFALLSQPTPLKSQILENERFNVYFSPHTVDVFLLDQQTGVSYMLVKDVEMGFVWNPLPTWKKTHKRIED